MPRHDQQLTENRQEWDAARKAFAVAVAYHAADCTDRCVSPHEEETVEFIERILWLVYGLAQYHLEMIKDADDEDDESESERLVQ